LIIFVYKFKLDTSRGPGALPPPVPSDQSSSSEKAASSPAFLIFPWTYQGVSLPLYTEIETKRPPVTEKKDERNER